MTELEQLKSIASEWTGAKDKRVCAICLSEVDRTTYNDHMKSHGYETLHIDEIALPKYGSGDQ